MLVASFENKHQVAETLLCWSNIIESAANEQGILYAIAMLQLVTEFREIGTPILHSTDCRFVVESEDGDIDPLGHGITSKTLPQVASPGESSQLPLFGQRLNLNLEFHSRHDRELASFIIVVY